MATKKIPHCPDCGTKAVKNGIRDGSTIQRYWCKNGCGRRFTDLTKKTKSNPDKVETPTRSALRTDTHVYIFTWAQNNTEIHDGFWESLAALRIDRNADLAVIKGRYRNPTAPKESEQADDDEWWDTRSHPYLIDSRFDRGPALTILADVRVQPTAVRPLVGLDSITQGKSGILGHPKLEMRVIPTPQNALPKQMITTGACTYPNYSDSKAGKKGEFNHTFGAVIVEMRDDAFHMRSINALHDGSFIDLDTEYMPDGSTRPAGRALALSMGDWHSGFTSNEVIEATFGLVDSTPGKSMMSVLKPEVIFWDDLLDQYGRNHHHIGNPFIDLAKQRDSHFSRGDLRDEVESACNEVEFYTGLAEEAAGGPVKSVIKSSNHDEALTRYIMERNWKNDPLNMEFYLETALMMAQGTKMADTGAEYPSALHVWASKWLEEPKYKLLGRRESYMIAGIECSFHGDIGPNGARGSIMNFSKIGVKTIINHSHTPGIVDGCYQGGTSTYLDLEYARGPSSWMNTHTVIYANGKRALLTIYGDEWRHE